MHLNGKRAEADSPAELETYSGAAEKGDAYSQARLGEMYLSGRGVIRDYALALAWLQKAAAQDNGEAQAQLGQMYEKGLGVDADLQQALAWYKRSSAQGHALGRIRLGDLYMGGLGVDQSTRKALACYLEAAEQDKDPGNSGLALLRMGAMYCQGRGVEKNMRQGFGIYQQAARLGNAEAQLRVGTMYRDGVGVERNYRKAREWLQKSIKKNWAPADSAMGDLYRDGLVVERDIPEAMKWYKQAAARGDAYGKKELTKLQQQGSASEKSAAPSPSVGEGSPRTMAPVVDRERPGAGAVMVREKTGKSKDVAVASRADPRRDGRPPAPQPLDAATAGRKSAPLKKASAAAPCRGRRAWTLPAPRIRLYLLAAIGAILSLIIVLIGFAGKDDEHAQSVKLAAVKMAALPWPATRLLPPALPEPPAEVFQPVVRIKAPPKPAGGASLPIVATAPAAMPSEPATPRLRREFMTLDEGQVAAMLAAGKLFDAKRNPSGSFPHRFEPLSVDGLRLIVDGAARLVWTRQQNPVKMNLNKTTQWIDSLNRIEYGGIRTWRLPTVEEAASLLQMSAGAGKPFLPDVFAADITEIWTGDSRAGSESWIIDFQGGTVRSAKNKSRLMSLMVSCEPGPATPTQASPVSAEEGERRE